jgi:hypothetical protein
MRSYWTGVLLNPTIGVYKKKKKDTKRPRGNGHMKVQAEMGAMLPQAKDTRGHEKLEKAKKIPALEIV